MRKSTLIISVILTAALLYALYSFVSTYKKAVQATVPATAIPATALPGTTLPATVSAEVTQELPTVAATEVSVAGKITIYEAAAMAVKVLGQKNLYLVENSQFNGTDAYLATFASGDILYISLDGQVLSASKGPAVKISQPKSHYNK
ncbi:MAG: hypothetical protein HZB50_06035 [Chloroflexi bacterium]|nr:hypothetical protein [Chloroflexota bacterium]